MQDHFALKAPHCCAGELLRTLQSEVTLMAYTVGHTGLVGLALHPPDHEGCLSAEVPTMAPTFFLPHLPIEFEEASFAHLAKRCGCEVPPIGKRVYSISFERGGIVWIATVGSHLKGRKPIRVKRNDTGRWRDIEDPALVLAIFPGKTYCLLTYPGTASHFKSAFYAIPRAVELFAI